MIMSYSQFAEAITSFGQGTGIPVTICYTEIPPCDFVSKREQFTGELKEQTDKAMEKSKELINEVANEYKEKIPEKIYNALINWIPDYIDYSEYE